MKSKMDPTATSLTAMVLLAAVPSQQPHPIPMQRQIVPQQPYQRQTNHPIYREGQ